MGSGRLGDSTVLSGLGTTRTWCLPNSYSVSSHSHLAWGTGDRSGERCHLPPHPAPGPGYPVWPAAVYRARFFQDTDPTVQPSVHVSESPSGLVLLGGNCVPVSPLHYPGHILIPLAAAETGGGQRALQAPPRRLMSGRLRPWAAGAEAGPAGERGALTLCSAGPGRGSESQATCTHLPRRV